MDKILRIRPSIQRVDIEFPIYKEMPEDAEDLSCQGDNRLGITDSVLEFTEICTEPSILGSGSSLGHFGKNSPEMFRSMLSDRSSPEFICRLVY